MSGWVRVRDRHTVHRSGGRLSSVVMSGSVSLMSKTQTTGTKIDAEVFRRRLDGEGDETIAGALGIPDLGAIQDAAWRHAERTFGPHGTLTRQQTAAALGISVSRLAQHRRARHVRHVKNLATRRVHYPWSEVVKLHTLRTPEVAGH